MTSSARKVPTDPEAFIAWENRQKARYELIGDLVRMMSGGTAAPDLIAANVIRQLGNRLEGTGCSMHGSSLKVRCASGSVVYPDAFVRCGPMDANATEVDDPILVLEVESPRTKRYDMNVKRYAYQSTPTLKHILFVNPGECLVELVTRQDGERWLSTLVRRLDAELSLDALGVGLPVAEIYAGTPVAGA